MLAARMDALEARIAELREREELDAIRPDIDGNRVMELLGVGPGRVVGEALDLLLEARLDEGPLGRGRGRAPGPRLVGRAQPAGRRRPRRAPPADLPASRPADRSTPWAGHLPPAKEKAAGPGVSPAALGCSR